MEYVPHAKVAKVAKDFQNKNPASFFATFAAFAGGILNKNEIFAASPLISSTESLARLNRRQRRKGRVFPACWLRRKSFAHFVAFVCFC
jgi:hypothetical protein